MGLLFFTVFVVGITSLIWLATKHLLLKERFTGLCCPRSYPFIGHAMLAKPDPEGFINQVMGMACMYPAGPRMVLLWLGPVPIVMLYSASLAEKVLSSGKHLNKGFVYSLLEPWLGQGIITSRVQNWRPKRKLLTPTFHYDILKDFLPIFNNQARILVNKLSGLPESKTVELLSYLTLCGLDIICETSMGRCVNAQQNQESEYVKAVHSINDLIQERARNPFMWSDFLYERFGNGELEKTCLRVLHTFTRKVISERQKELVERNWCFEGRLAFLDLLLEMVHQGQLNPDEVQQQVDTFMFAGHDTTSTSSAWVLFLLGCYPEIQRRVQAEVDEVLGDHDCILPEHLPRLKYLECCLKESLRLYPSVPMIMRELGESEELGGVSLPKGTQVVINQYMIHRDPTNWPDPENFDPDRFAHDSDVRRNPFAFIPFSAGSRNCIGQRFALMVEKVVVSWILRHFNIASIQTRCGMKTRTSLVLRPSNGIHVFLERRRAVTGEYKD